MEFGFTEEQQSFRQEVREFCQREPWGKLAPELASGYSPSFYRKVAEKGWLGLQIPKRYGGQGKDDLYEAIFAEEVGYSGAPLGGSVYSVTFDLFVNLILECGTEQQKKEYLPLLIKGEITAGGRSLTETEAGADLASSQTHAIRKGNYYIINGQKMFASHTHLDDGYSIIMTRTASNAPSEKGISLFIVDNKTPGISYIPLMGMGGVRTNQAFFDDVKVPAENLIGEENKGWDCFMQGRVYYCGKAAQAFRVGALQRMLDGIVRYTKETENNAYPLSHNPSVRQKLAVMAADVGTMRMLVYRLVWMLGKNLDALAIAYILKVFSDEAILRFDNSAMQILGLYGQLQAESVYTPLVGSMGEVYQADAIRHFVSGGTSVTRNFIATHRLGLPSFSA